MMERGAGGIHAYAGLIFEDECTACRNGREGAGKSSMVAWVRRWLLVNVS